MAYTLEDSGTVTTDGTEQTLSTKTGNKTYIFSIDLALMANADLVEIRIKYKVLTGGTERLYRYVIFSNIQTEPAKIFEPVPSDISYVVTIKRVGGSDHAYPWKLLSI